MKNNKNKKSTLKTKSYQTEQNKIYKIGKITSKRKWYDYKGMFFIFPSVMYEKNIDLNVDTKINRLTIAVGYHRWSFDKGYYNPIIEKKSWDKDGLKDFLSWAGLKTKRKWIEQDVVSTLSQNKSLKRLVYTVGLKKHYVKLMLLTEMIEFVRIANIYDNDPAIIRQDKLNSVKEELDEDIDNLLSKFETILEKK